MLGCKEMAWALQWVVQVLRHFSAGLLDFVPAVFVLEDDIAVVVCFANLIKLLVGSVLMSRKGLLQILI